MKTVEELNALKEEVETLNKKLAELTEEELAQVSGGLVPAFSYKPVIEPPSLHPVHFKHDLEPPVLEPPVLDKSVQQ